MDERTTAFLKYGVSKFKIEIKEEYLTEELSEELNANNWILTHKNNNIVTYERKEYGR